MSDGMGREPAYLSSHATNRYFIPNWGKKDSHKKTSCKALVMAHAYSNVVMDKIEECIKNGLSGNENDNW